MQNVFLRAACLATLTFGTFSWAFRSTELSTDWMLKSIHDHHVTNIEQLLGTFDPKSLQYHLLIYGSESQQFASYFSPRVLVYSYDADFIFTFNGEPGKAGYNDIEILRFDHDTKRFIPEVIHFDPKGKAEPKLEAHPTKCAGCHQDDVRPNWEPYFHWAGFYGSEDDNENARDQGFKDGVLRGSPENKKYFEFVARKYLEKATGKGRYRFLPRHPAARPNLHFNDRITCLNMKRVLRALAEHPEAGRVWPAFKGQHLHLDQVPPDLRKRALHSFEEVKADTLKTIRAAIARRVARQVKLTGAQPMGRVAGFQKKEVASPDISYDLDHVASWRYVFEELLDMPFRPMSTSRHDDYQLNLGSVTVTYNLADGALVDERGGLSFTRTQQGRVEYDEASYNYSCPQTPSVYDLPVLPPQAFPDYYEDDRLPGQGDALDWKFGIEHPGL